jgi:hypothetical protein
MGRGVRLAGAKQGLASAHSLAQAELQAADDLNVDQVHAELVATAAAVLMRAVALELRARRAAAQRAEERRLRRVPHESTASPSTETSASPPS